MTTPASPHRSHDLLEATRRCLQDHKGRLWSRTPHLDLRVGRKGLARGLAIWKTILDTIERSAVEVVLEDGKTLALVDGERLQMTVRERQVKAKHEPNAKERADMVRYPTLYAHDRWDLVPTGQFVFVLEDDLLWGARTQWIEGPRHRLEDHLDSIAQGLRAAAATKRAHRIESEEQSRLYAEKARRKAELEARRLEEQRKVDELLRQVQAWRQAVEIRQFVAALAESSATPTFEGG